VKSIYIINLGIRRKFHSPFPLTQFRSDEKEEKRSLLGTQTRLSRPQLPEVININTRRT
jgi:hypothetical protein